jgi:hypothetical protein
MPTFFRANPTFSVEALAVTPALTATNLAINPAIAAAASAANTAAPASASSSSIFASSAFSASSALPASAFNPALASAFLPFVDVSGNAPPPVIVRDGREVAPPPFNPARVTDFISHTVPIVRTRVPVAVSQSIPARTRVAKGTPVDLVFATASDIPFPVFDVFHPDLATKTVADLLPMVADPAIAPLLDKDPATLTADQKTVITTALATKGVTVVESDTSRNFAVAFQSLKNVQVFQ